MPPSIVHTRPKWSPPEPGRGGRMVALFEKRCQRAKEKPFLDEQPMVGPPRCSWRDFRRPLLRQFPSQAQINWKQRLGHGLDGIVWRAELDGRVFAVKVFWDNRAPEGTRYWAAQRECHNAALLQMIQTAINDSAEPIYLHPDPKGLEGAAANLRAFSDQGRREQTFRSEPSAVSYTSSPRLRQCFGWIKVKGEELCALNRAIRPQTNTMDGVLRQILPSEEYYAMVYEFIPKSQHAMDIEVAQSQLDLFWRAGFCLVPVRRDNWQGPGVLIDMADIICPWHAGWFSVRYKRHLANRLNDLA